MKAERKKLSEAELNKTAEEMFEYHKDVDEFIATEDGTFFAPQNKSAAELHARETKSKLRTFNRDGSSSDEDAPSGKTEVPTKKTKNEDIVAWLKDQGVEVEDPTAKKDDLLAKVKEITERED